MPSATDSPFFLFVHGLGQTNDMHPLAHAFRQRGFDCEELILDQHGRPWEDLRKARYEDWHAQVGSACDRLRQPGRRIFLVGFSLGALLCLDLASRREEIAGVLAISTFFAPVSPWMTAQRLKLGLKLPGRRTRRRPQVSHPQTLREIDATPYLPLEIIDRLIARGKELQQSALRIRCPVLFLHSLDDHVASYDALVEAIQRFDLARYQIVTFHELNHFVHFDIPPGAIIDLALEFFRLTETAPPSDAERSILQEVFTQCSEEARHWSGILFQLIAGFYSVFGALIYFTLQDVVQKAPRAPYYLVSYSLAINIYLILALLYFFYITRTLVFLKHHVEPQLGGFRWVSYRTLPWAAGKASNTMTRAAFYPMAILPLLISIALLVYCYFSYHERFRVHTGANTFLLISLIFTFVLWLFAAGSFVAVTQYEKRSLFRTAQPSPSTPGFERLLLQLYSRVRPGCVRQPQGGPAQR